MMSPPRAQWGRRRTSSVKATTFPSAKLSRRQPVKARADDRMPNADVRLVHSGRKHSASFVHARLKYKPHVIAFGPPCRLTSRIFQAGDRRTARLRGCPLSALVHPPHARAPNKEELAFGTAERRCDRTAQRDLAHATQAENDTVRQVHR
jgi:hypothetical protein